jgi:hypothetical protein
MIAAETLAGVLGAYAALGALFAIAFIARGIVSVDPVAKGSTIGFRLMVLPGVVALWPLLLRTWLRKGQQSHD